ncbi:MAG TPA: hypothetical protein PKN50_11945 [Spirochaetota bacterium]|nr:hypothetical protein [Spirochaetota bacterium]HPV42880.1 hypothetical protein [Spirochaetota bacterium]
MGKCIKVSALIVAMGAAMLVMSCSDTRYLSEAQVRTLYKNSRSLNETAAFLAGTDISKNSPLYGLTQDNRYAAYRQYMDGIWENYKKKNLANIESWRRKHVKDDGSGLVMYPFSGPDILNALAFFPGADEFVMIGLELPGNVPDPLHYKGPDIYMELWKIKNSLRTILQLNLFRTIEMAADFKADSFSNITGVMMFFLARYRYQILDIQKIYIDRTGEIKRGEPKPFEKNAEGVEFTFRKRAGAPVKVARFFSVDLSDGSLTRLQGFSSFLSGKKNFTTFIKSASYLLSYDTFRILRSYLLAGSRFLLQEDSGIPYRFFEAKDWNISLHGTYRVIAIFANRFQKDLDEAMKKNNRGPLPFDFGYGFEPEKSNIMIAVKKPRKG